MASINCGAANVTRAQAEKLLDDACAWLSFGGRTNTGERHGRRRGLGRHRQRRGACEDAAEELQGANHRHCDLVQGWTVWRGVECLQPRRRAARRRPARRRFHHLSVARLEVPSPHRRRRAWIRAGSGAGVPGEGRERPRARQSRGAVAAYQGAAPTASALAQGRTCAGAAASRRHLDDRNGHRQPAFLGFRLFARPCAQGRERSWRRHAAHSTQRSQVPRLRGLLLEGGAGLHLALLDHADGRRATSWTASTTPSCTGRMQSSSHRRFAGAPHLHFISRWPSG